ncbi:aminotransferase class I/II-fold pyridoxal phosphate-dependent enzyme [Thermoplasma sp.]|uniref:aminotransferase class I/II-fold pyridoxal phosphate-dependent enzyme n=1 Tax=Thermoplasma sp. TaxID=1973142 RepID=UPI001289AFAE|nr:aminotransferase class I/II-fold pyridoxal phosphate-dependent enzyme [Thermoplasma sp.]KAA8922397.1 MAG: aminotransferase class I/II-fold pyridoxal phosphate-dependent enzyme [Thermoplasma sp.]
MREHGGDVYRYGDMADKILDFSANVNAFLDTGTLARYPEVTAVDIERKIMKYTGSRSMKVIIGPGLTHFIYRIPSWLRIRRSLVITPNFNEYESSLAAYGAEVSSLSLGVLEKNPRIIRSYNPDCVFICSPVNPTGDIVDTALLRQISYEMNRIGGILFVDQAFGDFVPGHAEETVRIAEETGNMIIGRSLTKILAVPSLRIGYIMVSESVFNMIKDKTEPWSVCEPAIEFLRKTDLSAISKITLPRVDRERAYMIKELENLGFEILGRPRANFVAFRSPFNVDLRDSLLKYGILIRDLSDYVDLGKNCYRVAVRERSENRILIEALRSVITTF